MPALVDTHTHLGWAIIKTGRIDKDSYSKDNLIDHLHRLAYYGVAATQSMGIDPGETPYEVRANPVPDRPVSHRRARVGAPQRWSRAAVLEARGIWIDSKPTAGRPCRNSPTRSRLGQDLGRRSQRNRSQTHSGALSGDY